MMCPMEFFETIRLVRKNWQPYKVWELEQQKKEKQNEELIKKYPPTPKELEHAKQYGRTIVDVINTMDQHSIDKSEDAALMVGGIKTLGKITLSAIVAGVSMLFLKKHPNIPLKANLPPSIIAILSTGTFMSLYSMITLIWTAQMEKQASRIARFQTRRDDLKDTRHFVIYTQKQINEAEKIAKTLPEVKEKNQLTLKQSLNPIESFMQAKKTTTRLRKDYTSYLEWKKDYQIAENLKKDKFKNMSLSSETLSKAEKDRDNITNTIRKIENSSLNYLMNMKTAMMSALIIVEGTAICIGLCVLKIIEHLQKKKVIKDKTTIGGTSKLFSVKLAPFLGLFVLAPSIKLLKDASRIGRFKAKQELLANPQNFIAYDNEQRKKTQNTIKPDNKPISFVAKLKKDLQDIRQLQKDAKEYYHYKKTTRKEELKLDEALKQIKITDEQLNEAKNLQKQAFYAFEKMDEKAQRFTDDTEAGVNIARIMIMKPINIAASVLTFVYYGKIAAIRGNGKLKEFPDIFKVLKHFKAKDVIKVVGISLTPQIIDALLTLKNIQIEKEAGKIGVMTAMQDLEDPRNFIDEKHKK